MPATEVYRAVQHDVRSQVFKKRVDVALRNTAEQAWWCCGDGWTGP